ncbi:DUF4437 domain-containing protein [Vibrio jasicida]|uniref:DUF4437 domain-containing protein n=1 Tax=Vibrio jasicida TaxID=766224 RepID=UPI0003A3AB73|nr:DUF4437 domain-containing protein [Vibrio jasicida]
MKKYVITKSTLTLTALLLSAPTFAANGTYKIVAAGDIKWGYLNPLRGVLSPGAADLWGDRTTDTATGMLVRFNKGFESPPHIHNITYRGIVIKGLMHNDDPTSVKMWMPTGSYWTQPAGEDHITAASGETNLIYLEIDEGPYLVKPTKEQFDNGERPLNLHKDNIVWLGKSDLHDINVEDVKSTYVWGSTTGIGGSMVKLPAGFKGSIETTATEFRAVVISGSIEYNSDDMKKAQRLAPGSYIESTGSISHELMNNTESEATIYIRTNSKYKVN